jgi:hypothetical protein
MGVASKIFARADRLKPPTSNPAPATAMVLEGWLFAAPVAQKLVPGKLHYV